MAYLILVDDCRAAMDAMEPNSIDSIVTDPPYEINFMCRNWDGSGVAFDVETWRSCWRVLKPGGYLLSFGATRTVHRIAVAIEDAGFEIRDQIAWMFGSGFPKSLNVSKAIDKAAGMLAHEGKGMRVDGDIGTASYRATIDPRDYVQPAAVTDAAKQWQGWGTSLKPAMEPVIVARKPLCGTVASNVELHGTGAINIDGCRIDAEERLNGPWAACERVAMGGGWRADAGTTAVTGRWPANVILDDEAGAALDEQSGQTTSKPLADTDPGGASRFFYSPKADGAQRDAGLEGLPLMVAHELIDRNEDSKSIVGAGRTSDGRRNIHPTVKPIDLMRYLCRLVTPPGGTVLDPFCGSGSTVVAAVLEGFSAVGIDMETPHACIAWHRARHWDEMVLAPNVKASDVAAKPVDDGPKNLDLFNASR